MQLGSYVFGTGWSCKADTDDQTVPLLPIPRAQGGAFLTAQRKPRSWQIEGGFTTAAGLPNVTSGTVRDAIDSLKAALFAGPQNFFLDADRYWRNVQCESAPTDWEYYLNLFGTLSLKLVSPDPYAYSTTVTTTADLHTSLTYTLAVGNAFALPAWYLYSNSVLNTSFDWTWTNTTSGEALSLSGLWPISGAGYLIVDALNHTVKSAPSLGGTVGPADAGTQTNAFSLFDGQMPRLQQGANAFSLTQSGATLSDVWAVFAGRWL